MKKIAMIGAGKTGRGFLGRLLCECDREIIFVDKDAALVEKLNAAKSFRIGFFGKVRPDFTVSGYEAYGWDDVSLSDVELILVSVGGMNLPAVGAALKEKLDDGVMRHIIVCENASHPAKTLREAIGLSNITVSESTVFCTTIEDGELDIASENYPYLQCDAAPLNGYDPQLATIRPILGFENFLTRKLYTYNAASCVIAYLGFAKGYTDYGSAANDRDILELLDRNYAATNRVLCRVYGYEEQDQNEFALLSKAKFTDRTIADTVARNAREPQRKLQNAERIMGPLVLLDQYGEDTEPLLLTAASALLYEHESDAAWQRLKDENTPEELLRDICGLPVGSKLSLAILEKYEVVKAYRSGNGELL